MSENDINTKKNLSLLMARHCDRGYQKVDYGAMLLFLNGGIKSFINTVRIISLAKWVDINGDTPLTALVKYWPETEDERQLLDMVLSLVRVGCDLHARDRQGCTALAVATRRGLRPAVDCLINLGANVNTRSYCGVSTLSRATNQSLPRAKKEGSIRLYGMIVSCISLITDHGAKMEPSVYDEFGTCRANEHKTTVSHPRS